MQGARFDPMHRFPGQGTKIPHDAWHGKKKGFKKIKRGAGMGAEFDRELVMK